MSTIPKPNLVTPSVDEPPVVEGGPLTWRAVFLGFALVALMAVLTPYSDYVRHNTFLIGNHLPLIVVAVITILAVVVNPLLGRWRLGNSEMALAIGMMLISCAFPSSGFFRYFHSLLVTLVSNINVQPVTKEYVGSLPSNLFPSLNPNDPAIDGFLNGIITRRGETLSATWAAWITPYMTWALFYLPFFGAIMLFTVILRKQWVVHERLAFPLATIPMELMATPEAGFRLNALFRNRALWIGALIPFLLHLNNGIGKLYNSSDMVIPLNYSLTGSFSEYPWNQLDWAIQNPRLFFSVIGVTFFVPLEVAFSMWFCFLVYNIGMVFYRSAGVDISSEHKSYQGIGMYLVYASMLFWIARHHFLHVLKNLLQPREPEEFLPYWASVGGFLACLFLATAFLTVNGVTWWLALLALVLVIVWCMVLSRIVMEAGVLFVQTPGADPLKVLGFFFQGYTALLVKSEAIRQWMMLSISTRMGLTCQRENLMPFAANALRLGSEVQPRFRVRYLAMLFLALLGCLVISGATHHLLGYGLGYRGTYNDSYANTAFPNSVVQSAQSWADPATVPVKINRGANMIYGGVAMAAVALGRFLMTGFPLHPIGLLTNNTYPVQMMWFSIFVAWAIKLVILRWGGAKIFNQARPFFIGLLVGESLAGMMWMVVGLFVEWPAGAYVLLPS